MKTSPTQRSLALLRARGWTVAVVERWNAHAMIRQDLYGFADLLAHKPGEGIMAVQVTSGSNLAARRSKIQAEPRAASWLAAGGLIAIHGWRKVGPRGKVKRWEAREENYLHRTPQDAIEPAQRPS